MRQLLKLINICVTESRSSASEMLPTQSIRKGSTYSTDDDVFSSNALKNVPGKYLNYSLAISNVIYSLCKGNISQVLGFWLLYGGLNSQRFCSKS